MAYYIINKNSDDNGRNEVHTATCSYLPYWQNQESLGWHTDAVAAVDYAKRNGWKNADGCYFCCNQAHHG